ncbi:hypothetical protein ES702_05519 [subsurface metagenome]
MTKSRIGAYVPFSEGVPGILKLLGLSVVSTAAPLSRDGDMMLVGYFETGYHEVESEFALEKFGQHDEEIATRARTRARRWHELDGSHAKGWIQWKVGHVDTCDHCSRT